VFISIPIVHYPCTEYEFNPHLRHVKDDWSDSQIVSNFGQYIKRKQLGDVVGTYLLSNNDIIETDDLWLLINGYRIEQNLEMFIESSCQYLKNGGAHYNDVLCAMRYMYTRPEVSDRHRTMIAEIL
jgi:hypothetical protein